MCGHVTHKNDQIGTGFPLHVYTLTDHYSAPVGKGWLVIAAKMAKSRRMAF